MKLAKARMLMARDPLGIGVLWGYLALKTAEITNLRLIGTGLALHDPPQDIQRHLIVPRDV
jgi:vacuolar-type H+-ATPase subunit C/Vma6